MESTTNRIATRLAATLLVLALLVVGGAGCSKAKEEGGTASESTEPATLNKVKGRFLVDVAVRFEGLYLDEANEVVEAYFRVSNTVYPADTASQGRTVGTFSFRSPAGSGYATGARIALAPPESDAPFSRPTKLVYGDVSVEPTASLKSGFNEIDLYGSGRVELVLKLVCSPERLPADEAAALDWLRDVAADEKLRFSYEIATETAPGKELSADIEVTIPPTAFADTPAFVGTYGL